MRMNLDQMASDNFVLGRDILCEFDYWPLAVSMPPTKVCQQCKATVPVGRKTCECCDLAFQFKRKQGVTCERKQFNYEMYGSSRIR